MDESTILMYLQNKFDFHFDFMYPHGQINLPLRYITNVLFFAYFNSYMYDDDIIGSAHNKIILGAEGYRWAANCACFNHFFIGEYINNITRIYYTVINNKRRIIAVVYNINGKKIINFSDLMHAMENDLDQAEYFFVNFIMPVILLEDIPLKKTVTIDDFITSLIMQKTEYMRKYYVLKNQYEDIHRRLLQEQITEFFNAVKHWPQLLSSAGWRVTECGNNHYCLIYSKRIIPVIAVKRGVVYRVLESRYHIDKIIIKIEESSPLRVYAEGYHPNINDEGKVCLGELAPFTEPTLVNLFKLMQRLPELLKTVNFDSAYHSREEDYELAEKVDLLGVDTELGEEDEE